MKVATAVLFLGFVLSGAIRADQLPGYVPPLSRPIAVGESWTHPDGGLKVTFDRVVRDQRVRVGRKSEGSSRKRGNAVVEVTLEAGNQAPKRFFLSTRPGSKPAVIPAQEYPEGIVGIPKTYVVIIGKLLPWYSRQGENRSQRVYRLRLAVTVTL